MYASGDIGRGFAAHGECLRRGGALSRWATRAERRQHRLEDRQHARSALGTDDEIPHRLALLPAAGIGHLAQTLAPSLVGPGPAGNRAPAIEVPVRAPVARLQ